MPMSIKNAEVEQLAEEVSRLTRVSKTEAIRQALQEKRQRIVLSGGTGRGQRMIAFLEERVWPNLPPGVSQRWTKDEEDAALGYGEHGEPV
jgi:antitoxin VapB